MSTFECSLNVHGVKGREWWVLENSDISSVLLRIRQVESKLLRSHNYTYVIHFSNRSANAVTHQNKRNIFDQYTSQRTDHEINYRDEEEKILYNLIH